MQYSAGELGCRLVGQLCAGALVGQAAARYEVGVHVDGVGAGDAAVVVYARLGAGALEHRERDGGVLGVVALLAAWMCPACRAVAGSAACPAGSRTGGCAVRVDASQEVERTPLLYQVLVEEHVLGLVAVHVVGQRLRRGVVFWPEHVLGRGGVVLGGHGVVSPEHGVAPAEPVDPVAVVPPGQHPWCRRATFLLIQAIELSQYCGIRLQYMEVPNGCRWR